MSEWQPIETAPKADPDSMEIEEVLVYYPTGEIENMYWARDGWWPTHFDAEMPWHEPTHWMPLPLPPTSQPGSEKAG